VTTGAAGRVCKSNNIVTFANADSRVGRSTTTSGALAATLPRPGARGTQRPQFSRMAALQDGLQESPTATTVPSLRAVIPRRLTPLVVLPILQLVQFQCSLNLPIAQ